MAWTYFIRKVNEKGAILEQSSAGQDEEPAPGFWDAIHVIWPRTDMH